VNCGEEIRVKDLNGSYAVRFVAQCHGRYMVIAYREFMNGYLLGDWKAVLRELVALAVPRRLIEKTMNAESSSGGRYANIPLTYPLSTKGLADLLGVPADEVKEQLDDLLVEAD
jgi:hypothetical protein